MERNDINITCVEIFQKTQNDEKNCELQSTVDRISQISLKKERKFIPPRRTESKRLMTFSELNGNASRNSDRNSKNNELYKKTKNIYKKGTLLYRAQQEI
jgi:hypothetical protein